MNEVRDNPIVTIDGPAGSGKTTVAKMVAEKLGFRLVDTGALYRCLACSAILSGTDVDDEERLATLVENMTIRFEKRSLGQVVLYNEQDVTDRIRTPEVSQLASRVSVHPKVRVSLLTLQRNLGKDGGAVFEGRDVGTVVFPDAEVKVFLTASAEVRAERRFRELRKKGCEVEFTETLDELNQRDQRDVSRKVAPLRPADDAVLIDTSNINATQAAQKVIGLVENYLRETRG